MPNKKRLGNYYKKISTLTIEYWAGKTNPTSRDKNWQKKGRLVLTILVSLSCWTQNPTQQYGCCFSGVTTAQTLKVVSIKRKGSKVENYQGSRGQGSKAESQWRKPRECPEVS